MRPLLHRRRATLPEVTIFDAHFHVIDVRFPRAPRPFEERDLEIVREAAGERALYQNAADLYLR